MLRDLKKSLKQERGLELTDKSEKLLKTLFKYYSPKCKFTGNATMMSDIILEFKRGTHNEYSVTQEVDMI